MKNKNKINNPFEPVYIDGSDYDPLKDKDRKVMEEMFNSLSTKEQREFIKDLEEFNNDLGMFNKEK